MTMHQPSARNRAVVSALLLLLTLALLLSTALPHTDTPTAHAASGASWVPHADRMNAVAASRPGRISFAVVDRHGDVVIGRDINNPVSAASLIKVMILVGYLQLPEVAGRGLTDEEVTRLTRMITLSVEPETTTTLNRTGWGAVNAVAQQVGMTGFQPNYRYRGLSQVTARDMALLFDKLPDLLPAAHRAFALGLFSAITPSQQWGIPRATPSGWSWRVKGGWINQVVNQIGTLTAPGGDRVTIAVLNEGTPGTEADVQHNPDGVPGPATIELITRALVGSGEPLPAGRIAWEANRSYVAQMYRDFLGREPDGAGLDGWTGELTSGAIDRSRFSESMAFSYEASMRNAAALYSEALGRLPDPVGQRTWAKAIAARQVNLKEARARFWASRERRERSGSTDQWVIDLYRGELRREPDPVGWSGWVAATPAIGHRTVADAFVNCSECAAKAVTRAYQELLGRNPDPVGFDGWVSIYPSVDYSALTVHFGASAEYYRNATGMMPTV